MENRRVQVDIVIPNYNGRQMVVDCLASIRCQTFQDLLVTVVDNGSADDSVAHIIAHCPEVKLLSRDRNTGFSAAVNAGIQAGEAPLVFLLNNDTELEADCLKTLVQAAALHPECFFFAPKMLSYPHILPYFQPVSLV